MCFPLDMPGVIYFFGFVSGKVGILLDFCETEIVPGGH